MLADRLTQLLLVALVASKAPGSTLTLASALIATTLPALILNPFAGAYVDRWDRKRTMITCDFIRVVLILLLPALISTAHPIWFMAAVFLLFSVSTFFVPARLALIPDLVPPERLGQANALFTTSGMIGSCLILLIGAFLMEWFGPARSSLVNAAGYLTSALLLAPIVRKGRRLQAQPPSQSKMFKEIAEGLREIWRHHATRWMVGLLGFLMAGAGASIVVGTVLVQRMLGSVTKDLGIFSLWLGVGMLVGSLGYGRWGAARPHQGILGISFLGCGVSLWLFVGAVVLLRSGVVASMAAGLLGVWLAPIGISANTLVHKGHPEHLHGRIFSSLGVAVNLSLILSMWISGWLTEKGGHALFMGVLGSLFAAAGLVLLYYGQKEEKIRSWEAQPLR